MNNLKRLSLNQMTTKRWSLPEAVDGCARAGIPAIGLWREPITTVGLRTAAKLVADAGLRVSSLCRAGFFTSASPNRTFDDNRRAIDEAAALNAACLIIVVGGLPSGSRDLSGARAQLVDQVAELARYAADAGVRLALEPFHPMYCADRAIISSLNQALDIAEYIDHDHVGVAIDTFHLWWDPQLLPHITRAAHRIAAYQVADWITPLPADALLARGIPGDGHIDFAPISAAINSAGYTGDIELEIFNQQVWDTDPTDLLTLLVDRYYQYVVARK